MTDFLLHRFVKDYENIQNPAVHTAIGKLSGTVGIACNVLLFLAKLLAGILTGSVSIMADAVNNLSDASSSVVTLIGFKIAAKPADSKHPYGHARVEYMSGLLVSAMILMIGYTLAESSLDKILHPAAVEFSLLSIVILVLSILVKFWMNRFNVKLGNYIHSTTLLATAADSRNDVISTAVVLLSCLISKFTGLQTDGWMGLAVALFILYSGVGIAWDTISPLLGQTPDPNLVAHIQNTILSRPEVLGVHDIIVHDYGPGRIFATAHAEIDYRADVLNSHEVLDELETQFRNRDNLEVTLHYDPIVTDDPELNELKSKIRAALNTVDPRMQPHDIRMVKGKNRTNVVFDVLMPMDAMDRTETVENAVRTAIHSDTHKYVPVIHFDSDLAGYTQSQEELRES